MTVVRVRGRPIDFGDMDKASILDAIKNDIIPKLDARDDPSTSAIGRGVSGLFTSSQMGVAGLLQAVGAEETAEDLFEDAQRDQTEADERRRLATEDQTFVGKAGTVLGESVGPMGAALTGGIAGGKVGAGIGTMVMPGLGTAVGGTAGAFLGGVGSLIPFYFGGNIDRQIEEGTAEGLSDARLDRAAIGAVGQASVDQALNMVTLGFGKVLKIPGYAFSGSGKTATREFLSAARNGLAVRAGAGAGKAAIGEGAAEAIQQSIEILQANPDKFWEFGAEVQDEIIESAKWGAIAGAPIGAVTSAVSGAEARGEISIERELGKDGSKIYAPAETFRKTNKSGKNAAVTKKPKASSGGLKGGVKSQSPKAGPLAEVATQNQEGIVATSESAPDLSGPVPSSLVTVGEVEAELLRTNDILATTSDAMNARILRSRRSALNSRLTQVREEALKKRASENQTKGEKRKEKNAEDARKEKAEAGKIAAFVQAKEAAELGHVVDPQAEADTAEDVASGPAPVMEEAARILPDGVNKTAVMFKALESAGLRKEGSVVTPWQKATAEQRAQTIKYMNDIAESMKDQPQTDARLRTAEDFTPQEPEVTIPEETLEETTQIPETGVPDVAAFMTSDKPKPVFAVERKKSRKIKAPEDVKAIQEKIVAEPVAEVAEPVAEREAETKPVVLIKAKDMKKAPLTLEEEADLQQKFIELEAQKEREEAENQAAYEQSTVPGKASAKMLDEGGRKNADFQVMADTSFGDGQYGSYMEIIAKIFDLGPSGKEGSKYYPVSKKSLMEVGVAEQDVAPLREKLSEMGIANEKNILSHGKKAYKNYAEGRVISASQEGDVEETIRNIDLLNEIDFSEISKSPKEASDVAELVTRSLTETIRQGATRSDSRLSEDVLGRLRSHSRKWNAFIDKEIGLRVEAMLTDMPAEIEPLTFSEATVSAERQEVIANAIDQGMDASFMVGGKKSTRGGEYSQIEGKVKRTVAKKMTKKIAKRAEKQRQYLQSLLNAVLKKHGLDNIKGEVLLSIDEQGGLKEGAYNPATRVLRLAMDFGGADMPPDLTMREAAAHLDKVLNHELIHAMRPQGSKSRGILKPSEWSRLVKAARSAVTKSGQKISETANVRNASNARIAEEEMVSDMYRAFAQGNLEIGSGGKGILGKIVRYVSDMIGIAPSARQIMTNIQLGRMISRDLDESVSQDANERYSESEAGSFSTYAGPEVSAEFEDIASRNSAGEISNVEGNTEERFSRIKNFNPVDLPSTRVGQPTIADQVDAANHRDAWLLKNVKSAKDLLQGARKKGFREPNIERLYQALVDRFASAERIVNEFNEFRAKTGVAPIAAARDPYIQEDSSANRKSSRRDLAESRYLRPILRALEETGITEGQLHEYSIAMHAEERNAVLGDNAAGITDAEAKRLKTHWKNSPQYPEMRRIHSLLLDYVEDTRELRASAGLTQDYTANGISGFGPNYVPLTGHLDADPDADGDVSQISTGVSITGNEDMGASGRGSLSRNILHSVVLQNRRAINRHFDNQVGMKFLDMVRSEPDFFKKKGVFEVKGKNSKSSADVVGIMENGKQRYLVVKDKNLASALKGGSTTAQNIMRNRGFQKLAGMTRFMSGLATSWNPAFTPVNAFRDFGNAMLVADKFFGKNAPSFRKRVASEYYQNVKNISEIEAMIRAGRDIDRSLLSPEGSAYLDFIESGGRVNYLPTDVDQSVEISKIKDEFKTASEKLAEGKVRFMAEAWAGAMERLNAPLENNVRFSAYKEAMAQGMGKEKAGQIAREISTNFAKKGDFGPVVNSLFMFYNAGVQGARVTLSAALQNKAAATKLIGGPIAAGMFMDMMNRSLMGEEYENVEEWVKKRNILIPLGQGNGFVVIPMPLGFNAFYDLGRRSSKTANEADYNWDDTLFDTISTFDEAFMPVGGGGNWWNRVTPTILDPLMDVSVTGKNFMGSEIVPQSFNDTKPMWQTHWASTSGMYKGAAKLMSDLTGGTDHSGGWIDISPNEIEYLMTQYTSGVGRMFSQMAGVGETVLGMNPETDGLPEIRDVPIARSFYHSVGEKTKRRAFYETRDDVMTSMQAYENARKAKNGAAMVKYLNEMGDDFPTFTQFMNIDNSRRQIRTKINQIVRNEMIPDEKKTDLIKSLKEREEGLMDTALRLYRKRFR